MSLVIYPLSTGSPIPSNVQRTPDTLKFNTPEDDNECWAISCAFRKLMKPWLNRVELMPVSIRALNVMRKHGITRMFHLRALLPMEISRFPNCGAKVRAEIRHHAMEEFGLTLPNWEEKAMHRVISRRIC